MTRTGAETAAARDRFRSHAENPTCSACHSLMDPFAQPLETFDILGRIRSTETVKGKSFKIDPSATLSMPGPSGAPQPTVVKNAIEMASALSESPAYRDCFVQHLFQDVTGREDACWTREAQQQYARGGEDVVALAKWLFTDSRFLTRPR